MRLGFFIMYGREFQVVDDVLGRFAGRAGPARRALVGFMGTHDAIEDRWSGLVFSFPLGDWD